MGPFGPFDSWAHYNIIGFNGAGSGGVNRFQRFFPSVIIIVPSGAGTFELRTEDPRNLITLSPVSHRTGENPNSCQPQRDRPGISQLLCYALNRISDLGRARIPLECSTPCRRRSGFQIWPGRFAHLECRGNMQSKSRRPWNCRHFPRS